MTQHTERTIKLAARLYEARDTAKTLLGDRFKEKMAVGIQNLEALAKEHNITVLEAAMRTAKVFNAEYNGRGALLVMAAAVEQMEPTP
mgnify:FL=1